MGNIVDKFCNDFLKENPSCRLCRKVFQNVPKANLIKCNWLPKRKINVKLAQQKLF